MAQVNWMRPVGARHTNVSLSSAALELGLLLIIAVTSTSCGSEDSRAEAVSPPPALVTDQTRGSDPHTGFALTNDFERIFYPKDTEAVVRIGRDNGVQKRAFLSATVMYQPPLTVEEIAHYVGADPNPTRDMVAMRCRPLDPSKVEPILATWPNVFKAVVADLGAMYTPTDCPASPTDPVDRQVYCTALAFSDQANTKVPLSLLNAVAVGVETFELQGAPFQPTGSTQGADVLYDLYGIGYGFAGLGFSVKNSFLAGKPVALTAAQALEQSVVPEYLLDNVPLADGNCKCIRVRPYANRDQSPLNWDTVTALGNQNLCTTFNDLP
ncbi:MAG: hypothetical protein ACHQ9S_14120 [Candidatus Binatia bacterium]